MLIKTNPNEVLELLTLADNEKSKLENEIKRVFRLKDEQVQENNKMRADYTDFIDRLRDELYRDDISDEIMLFNLRQIIQAESDNNLPF